MTNQEKLSALENENAGLKAQLGLVKEWADSEYCDDTRNCIWESDKLFDILSSTDKPLAVVDGYMIRSALDAANDPTGQGFVISHSKFNSQQFPVTAIIISREEAK